MSNTIHAGIVQFDVKTADPEENLNRVLSELTALAKVGAGIAVLPELWSGGFHDHIASDARQTPAILEMISKTAVSHQMAIAGSLAEATDQGIYNTLYVYDIDGALAGKYRKVHLFSATGEERSFLAGDQCRVCKTAVGTLGLVICYDIRFPEYCLSLALQGAEALIVCAQWPASRIHHWQTLVCARAIENQMPVLAANRCGKDTSIVYGGHSRIVTATGKAAAVAGDAESTSIHAVIDGSEQKRFREAIPSLKERRPDVYRLASQPDTDLDQNGK